jgi:hypothetical protein
MKYQRENIQSVSVNDKYLNEKQWQIMAISNQREYQ